MMSEDIVQALSAFERANPIESYRFYDWNVWPLLRVIVGYHAVARLSGKVSEPPAQWDLRKLVASIPFLGRVAVACNRRLRIRRLQRELERLKGIDPVQHDDPLAAEREIVILTISGRRQDLGGSLYEIYADPLTDCFRVMGASSLVWERLEERWPRHRPSAWISRRLELELLQSPQLPELPEPDWFAGFAPFAAALAGRTCPWREFEVPIRALQRASLVYQRWLRQTGARVLISICWYDAEVMAATLAARRLGVTSVDLQHGAQGAGHFAYDGWVKAPSTPFELVPDRFWCWGDQPAERLVRENPGFGRQCRALTGGNLWLNCWRSRALAYGDAAFDALAATSAGRTTILVALQHGYDYNELVLEAVGQAPEEWFWLVRLHPATPQSEKDLLWQRLEQLGPARVEYRTASDAPLLSLLTLSDVLITGSSTCALEALAFGLPSITVTEEGTMVYREYLERGLMLAAGSAAELLHKVEESAAIDRELCRRASHELFAGEEQSEENIRRFLDEHGVRHQAGEGGCGSPGRPACAAVLTPSVPVR